MEQTLSEVISLESVPCPLPGNDLPFGQNDRIYLSQANSINGSDQVFDRPCSQAFEMQIWLFIVELFLKLDQVF